MSLIFTNIKQLMKPSYIFLAPGFEEIEALATVDVLRRCGMELHTVSIGNTHQVEGAHGISVNADKILEEIDIHNADWLILPGGMPGATNLAQCDTLTSALLSHYRAGHNIAAICASPAVVLAPLGILDNKNATCYPGFESQAPKARMTGREVEIAHNVITANGPASTLLFAFAIATATVGADKAKEVSNGMLYTNERPPEF